MYLSDLMFTCLMYCVLPCVVASCAGPYFRRLMCDVFVSLAVLEV